MPAPIQGQTAVLAHALPDQPGSADFGDGGQHEQGDRAEDHGVIVALP
jgi:hypothetical protein